MERSDYALAARNLLFRGVDFTSVEYMLERCTSRDLSPGETLLHPDIPNYFLYLILEGALSVQLVGKEAMEYTSLVSGDCAGDISLVDGKPPSALVVATQPTRVLAIPHDTVWSLVNHSHEVARNLLLIIAVRMRNDNNALVSSQNIRMQFEHQASVDALTGVHNRHWMNEAFPRALLRCKRNQQATALLFVDIDFFKRVNDTYGHLVGDVALRTVAECMARNLRPFDLLVRYGGEEFALLLPNTDQTKAEFLAERLRATISDCDIQSGDVRVKVTASIGVALSDGDKKLDVLLKEADHALYRAKDRGRNCVEIFSETGSGSA
jgi:diguanylate cyclase (GGDEF)-like protein